VTKLCFKEIEKNRLYVTITKKLLLWWVVLVYLYWGLKLCFKATIHDLNMQTVVLQ